MHKIAVCSVALCLAVASSASASTKTRLKFKGQTATGTAEYHDGCVDAFFGITASDETTKDSTGATVTRSVNAGYGGRDLCRFLSFGGNLTYRLPVTLNNSSVTIPFDFSVDYANTETDERSQRRMVGTVTITATGDFDKSKETTITQTDSTRTVSRSKGNTRDADVTVNAKLDGVPLTFETGTGSLGTVNQGTLEIERY